MRRDPWPIPSDIVDACGLQPAANSAALTAVCERERAGLQSGFENATGYTGPGGVELVTRLNELYGIPPIP